MESNPDDLVAGAQALLQAAVRLGAKCENEQLTRGTVAQSFSAVLAARVTPAKSPKPRRKSPGLLPAG